MNASRALGFLLSIAAWLLVLPVGGAEKAEPKLEANAMPEGKTQFQPKPVPRMQAVPLPSEQVSFQRDGAEIARYHYGASLRRPFLYPILGPAGRSLTRMGHPHDPVGHGHHDSVWTSHNDVDGTDFWSNGGPGTIVHLRVEKLEDGDDRAALTVRNAWKGKGDVVLLNERRTVAVHPLEKREWLLVVDLELEANGKDVTLGKTPFGVFSVRMAKTIGVHDGGGMIRNSEGGVNEEGVFWKRARWVDYSGLIAPDTVEGITLLDHPANPNHPSFFHVRNDGWMGASLTLDGPRTLQPGQPLRLRYGLYVHGGLPKAEVINARWEAFAKLALAKAEERK